MACSKCTSGCTGACAPGCTGQCSVRACAYGGCGSTCTGCSSCSGVGCSGGCSGCSGCGSGCASTCTGTCSKTCTGSCSSGCTTTCELTCKDFCNQGCENSSMSLTLNTRIEAENVQDIADAILFEIARRPQENLEPTLTSDHFKVNNIFTINDAQLLIDNLNMLNQDITNIPEKDKTVYRTFGEELINKILASNEQDIPIP